MAPGHIVIWEIEPLERSRRGLDERVRIAVPGVARRLGRRLMKLPAGSPMRRRALTQNLRVAMAATNRGDYDSVVSGIHPDAVLEPPGKGQGGLDFDSKYHGREGARRFITQWKSGFEHFRYEPRAIADAGGAHFALKVRVIGTFAGSGTELRDEWATVYTLKDGMAYRMENKYEWADAIAKLEELSASAS